MQNGVPAVQYLSGQLRLQISRPAVDKDGKKGGELSMIKGYDVQSGYMGYIPWLHKYILFATDKDYLDFVRR